MKLNVNTERVIKKYKTYGIKDNICNMEYLS